MYSFMPLVQGFMGLNLEDSHETHLDNLRSGGVDVNSSLEQQSSLEPVVGLAAAW